MLPECFMRLLRPEGGSQARSSNGTLEYDLRGGHRPTWQTHDAT
jgi:hypothetical protein